MDKIPDQSGEVEVRLRIMPWLHDEVMSYGREHGIRSTTERYCLALTHLLRVLGRLPKIKGYDAAICGIPGTAIRPEFEAAILRCQAARRCTRQDAFSYIFALGVDEAEMSGFRDGEDEAEARMVG